MAKKAKLDMTVDVVNNTEAGLIEVEKSVDRTAKSMQRAGKKTSKDWSGVSDLFSTLLPRGMQRTIRSFKSTGRSVQRLSKGFKVLRGVWAGLGIGALIVGLEALITNWDKISEVLGLSNAESERKEKLNNNIASSQKELTADLQRYLWVIGDISKTEEERKLAIERVNSALGNVIDTEADANDQRKIAYELLELKKEQIAAEANEIDAKNKLLERGAEIETELNRSTYLGARERLALEKEADKLRLEHIIAGDALVAIEAKIAKRIDDTANAVAKRNDAEKQAERTKAESTKQAEANAKYIANLEKTLSEEIMLAKIEDEEKRALKVLELRSIEEWEKAYMAGATDELLNQITEKYFIDKADIEKQFRESKEEEDEAARQQALADEQALEDELFMIRTNGRDRELTEEQLKHEEEIMMSFDAQAKEELRAQQEFDRRIAQAGENKELIKMVEEEYQNELTEIEKKGEKERNDIVQDGVDQETKIRQAGAKAVISATQNLFGTMEALAGENEKAAQGFAITGVLLAQAVALANGIKTATQSSVTVWDMIAGIVASTAAVLGAFVGVKAILNEATDGGGGNVGGGAPRPQITPLVPTGVARLDSPSGSGNNQAFVVQSELEGANLNATNMYGQTSLNPG
jgi:hypothetical protein